MNVLQYNFDLKSVRLENGPKFPCVSKVRPTVIKSRENAVELILFVLYFLK